jgi:hypothetical protein
MKWLKSVITGLKPTEGSESGRAFGLPKIELPLWYCGDITQKDTVHRVPFTVYRSAPRSSMRIASRRRSTVNGKR